jgi:hypothetical protein
VKICDFVKTTTTTTLMRRFKRDEKIKLKRGKLAKQYTKEDNEK